jgi:hypothetical protein
MSSGMEQARAHMLWRRMTGIRGLLTAAVAMALLGLSGEYLEDLDVAPSWAGEAGVLAVPAMYAVVGLYSWIAWRMYLREPPSMPPF